MGQLECAMGKLLSFLGQPSAASSKSRPTRWRTHYACHRLGLMSPRGLIHNNKGCGHGWTYVEDFWCHFILNNISLDLHNSMEHVIFYSGSALLRKQRPEKLLNSSKGKMWTQTSASRAGWHLWYPLGIPIKSVMSSKGDFLRLNTSTLNRK